MNEMEYIPTKLEKRVLFWSDMAMIAAPFAVVLAIVGFALIFWPV